MLKRTVLVKFHSTDKEYAYLTDLDFEVGDFAVVDTRGRENHGYQVVKIIQVHGLMENQRLQGSKWIVQKLDVSGHLLRIEKQKIAQEIRNKLKERREAMDEIMIYKTLAADDPEVNRLLHKLAEFDETAKLLLPTEPENKSSKTK